MPGSSRFVTVALRALEVAVVVLCAVLIWQNMTMRRQVAAVASQGGRVLRFAANELFNPVPVVDMNGRRAALPLQDPRTLIAVVEPGCDSCIRVMRELRDAPGVRIVSTANLEDTRRAAESTGVTASTFVLGTPIPRGIRARFTVYPQLLVVERGRVVRTCATVAECR